MKFCISSKTTCRSWCIHWYKLHTANSSKVLSPCTVSIAILEIFGNLWLQKNLPTMVTRCEAPSEGFVQVPCSAGAVSEYEPMGVWIGKWQFHRYKTQGNYGQSSLVEVWGSNKGLKLCIWQIFCRGSYFECDLHCEVKWIDSFEVINFAGGRLTARNFTFLVLLRLVVNRGVWSGRYGVLPVVKWYIGETPTWEFYRIVDIASSKSSVQVPS